MKICYRIESLLLLASNAYIQGSQKICYRIESSEEQGSRGIGALLSGRSAIELKVMSSHLNGIVVVVMEDLL